MGKLYELLKSEEVPAPSFGLDFERMGTNKIADAMVRGKHSRNSDKWTVNRHGILVKAEEDRISLDLKDGEVGYLAESGGTNLALQSEEFDVSPWSNSDTTLTPNNRIAPDATLTADTITITNSASRVQQNITTGSGKFVFSVFVFSEAEIEIRLLAFVDGSSVSKNRTIMPNKWQRIEAVFEPNTQITQVAIRGVSDTGEISIWGAQLETGSVATSYIPTEGSTASRGADNLIFEDAEDLIGQQSGVILLRSAWLSDSASGLGTGLKLGTSSISTRGISTGIADGEELRVSSRNVAGVNNNTIDSQYTTGDYRTILISYDYQGQDPNTNVVNGINLWMDGAKIGDFNLRVPDEGQELNRILLQGSVGGVSSNDDQGVNKYDQFTYLWNTGDWLTDSLAEQLTDNNS